MVNFLLQLDQNILLWIQDFIRMPVLNDVFTFLTHLGDGGFIWILLSLILIIPKKTRKIGVISITALCLSLLVNNGILKNLVGRTRPYDVVEGLVPLLPRQVDSSFPSGHTGASFASAVVLLRQLPKRYGIPAVVLATLIAFSRLYLGVHYPSDVLFGLISGILMGYLAESCVNRLIRNIKRKS